MTDISKLTETERGAYLAQMDFLKKEKIFELEKELKWHKERIVWCQKQVAEHVAREGNESRSILTLIDNNTHAMLDSKVAITKIEEKLYFYTCGMPEHWGIQC